MMKTTRTPTPNKNSASRHRYLCAVPNCHSTCSTQMSPVYARVVLLISWFRLVMCPTCSHPYYFHVRLRSHVNLDRVVDDAMDRPLRSSDEYAGPWSSGSRSALVEKALGLLRRSHRAMEQQGFSREQLKLMQRNLERVKWWLDLQQMAKEEVR